MYLPYQPRINWLTVQATRDYCFDRHCFHEWYSLCEHARGGVLPCAHECHPLGVYARGGDLPYAHGRVHHLICAHVRVGGLCRPYSHAHAGDCSQRAHECRPLGDHARGDLPCVHGREHHLICARARIDRFCRLHVHAHAGD